MVEAAGVEPEKRRFPNYLTACELWSQVVVAPSLTTAWLVLTSPPETTEISPILGEIVEAAGTAMQRTRRFHRVSMRSIGGGLISFRFQPLTECAVTGHQIKSSSASVHLYA